MTASSPAQATERHPQAGSTIGYFLLVVPVALVALCFAGKYGLVDLGPAARGTLIFALLFALMVTGMPVSIALGLSVLTFLFTLTQVPLEAVALKLFTGIESFGAGVITTSGSLGILIPPSIPMVIYAVATNSSVGKLFIAGIVPGIMLATLLGLTTWRIARKNNYPRLPKATWGARLKAFLDAFWGLLLIVIVIGGIYGGLFTPTEAAAMSAVYAFVIAVFVYRDLGLKDVPGVLLASANLSAMLLYIITNAVLFSFLMTHENIPQALANWITAQGLGWIGFLLIVNILLLLAGNVMDPSSIIVIMAPILFPVAMKLGIDPIHFGILITVNMEVGLCHPPVGLNLYVASGIAKMGITELTIAVWPWLLTMLCFLVVVTYVPQISLWLPKILGMM